MVKPIDLIQIQEKAASYTSFHEFKSDLLWFEHNCAVMTGDSKTLDEASAYVKSIKEEIASIFECAECFDVAISHPVDFFTIPCKKNHPVVWAKPDNYVYWPAKLVTKHEDDTVHVRFFGDHTVENIPASSYTIFTENQPGNGQCCDTELYTIALEVCLFH